MPIPLDYKTMASQPENGTRQLKRRRLNHACDRCRSRKIRCDDRQPECGNCWKAKAVCMTRDARTHTLVTRHEAQRPPESSAGTPATANSQPSPARRRRLNDSEEQENDVHPPGHGAAAARLPAFPRFINGNSIYILAQWLDLAFARLNHTFSLSHVFDKSRGRLTAESPCDDTGLGSLSNEHRAEALERYLATVHRVFTILPTDFWTNLMSQVHHEATLPCTLAHLVIASGGNAASRGSLNHAFSNLGVLVQAANLESVAALTLMVIILRGQEDSERALHILSIASSIAHTLGLHRRTASFNEDHITIWWTLYSLDKALAIELERPITIKSQDCDQQRPAEGSMLSAIVELACIQEVVVEKLFQERRMEESDQTLQEIIVHKMRLAGELDILLLGWHANLAMSMRPAEHLFCEEEDFPAVSYLALQYFQTAFLVHRNSLITNRKHVRSIADEVFADEAYRLRLRNGPFICYGIAKSIISLLGRIYDTCGLSILNTMHAPLIAAIGLATYIFKHASSSAVKADLELLSLAISFIERKLGPHEQVEEHGLGQLLRSLHHDLKQRTDEKPNTTVPTALAMGDGSGNQASHGSESTQQNTIFANLSWPNIYDTSLQNFQNQEGELFTQDLADWPEFLQMLDLEDLSNHNGPFS